MDADIFWTLIESARQASSGDLDRQIELLTQTLAQLPESEILDYVRVYFEIFHASYRANLWEAADVIHCGCSDSGFEQFRNWLMAQGRTAFERALEDPETLVDVIAVEQRLDIIDDCILPAPWRAYNRKTGHEMPLIIYPPTPLVGELGEEDQRPAKFPRLAAKFKPEDCDKLW